MNASRWLVLALLAPVLCAACRNSTPVEASVTAASAAASAPALSVSGNGPTFHYRIHNDYAEAYFSEWTETSHRYLSVSVSSGGTGKGAEATLSLWGGQCTRTGPEWWEQDCTYFNGWGNIPARDVKGSFGSGISVHTDLRDNPDFWLWGLDPGIVAVAWQKDGLWERRETGTSEQRFGHVVFRTNGPRHSASASASGTLLGLNLPPGGNGSMGSARGTSITFGIAGPP